MAELTPMPGGFVAPPAGDAPQNIPPAQPAALSPVQPIRGPNDKPGFVQPPAIPSQEQIDAKGVQPGPAGQLDAAGIAALIQAALGQAPAQPGEPAAATAAPVAEDAPAWLGDVNTFDVSTIQDPVIKSMATILQTAGKGVDLNRAIGLALSRGDVSLIDAAYLKESAGDRAADLLALSRSLVTAASAQSDAITKEVYDLLGGEAAYSTAVAAFNKNAPHELRVTVAKMLDSTDPQFIKAGAKIMAQFGRASGLMVQPGAPLLGPAAAVGGQANGLSAAEFKAEIGKLDRYAPDYAEKHNELFARRQLGKRSGL